MAAVNFANQVQTLELQLGRAGELLVDDAGKSLDPMAPHDILTFAETVQEQTKVAKDSQDVYRPYMAAAFMLNVKLQYLEKADGEATFREVIENIRALLGLQNSTDKVLDLEIPEHLLPTLANIGFVGQSVTTTTKGKILNAGTTSVDTEVSW
jgi:hypothetical protein